MGLDQIRHAVETEIIGRHVTRIHRRPKTFLVMTAVDPAVFQAVLVGWCVVVEHAFCGVQDLGFLNALGLKPQISALPDSVLRCFFYYLSVCSKTDLLELTEAILSTFNPDSPEVCVIEQHLNRHIDTLHYCIHQL